ncbi:MAG: BamA/TamA family outer membrane protein [Gemmatimonadetes bacterium]|nr:BamA/TamA family outer membrane protein [Gemmatimonadota bacterium]
MACWRGSQAGLCPCLSAAVTLLLAFGGTAHGQVNPPPAPGTPAAVVAPGAGYRAGALEQRLFGRGYRELWTTPIEVPVVDLETFAGGLTPLRLGGGSTTRTLHLRGGDGRRYVLRSVEKSPIEFEIFNRSILADMIQDQISSFHPTGAPVVSALLDAVDVLHTQPTYMVVPDDPRLAEFREEFRGLLVLVEERPDDGPDGAPGFAGSRRIASTEELFEALEENPDHRVDARGLLRARLVDLIVGDRDRSHNNHLWAAFESPEGTVWRVIPRDRDQAFVRFDGTFKWVVRAWERRLVVFEDHYPDIFALTRNAWDIDRQFLVGLDREAWAAIVLEVREALDDEVIAAAVERMPPEHYSLIGAELTTALQARRDHLDLAASRLYEVVFDYADIHATDAAETLSVTRYRDASVEVIITVEGGQAAFRRTFVPEETSEVRVYMRGGADEVFLRGEGAEDITVRVLGGGGRDSFHDESAGPGGRTIVYDAGEETRFPDSDRVSIRRSAPSRPMAWFEDRRELDWGSQTIPQPTASYDDDRGLMLSPGIDYRRYTFGKRPLGTRVQVKAGWAFGLNEPVVDLRYLGRRAVGGHDLRFDVLWSGVEIINFYGFGNETSTTRSKAYHRVAHQQFGAELGLTIGEVDGAYLQVGPSLVHTSTDTLGNSSFISETDPYGAGSFTRAGFKASFGVDHRDHQGRPTRGVRVEGRTGVFPGILDLVAPYQEVRLQVATYLSPPGGQRPVVALRVAGEKVWGTFPFASAAFLGGPRSLRSLRFQRYAGDGLLLGSAEVRLPLWKIYFPIPLDIGMYGLGDAGRVWSLGEQSDTWHTALGGGIFFGLPDRSEVVRLAVAWGEDRTAFMAGLGFIY